MVREGDETTRQEEASENLHESVKQNAETKRTTKAARHDYLSMKISGPYYFPSNPHSFSVFEGEERSKPKHQSNLDREGGEIEAELATSERKSKNKGKTIQISDFDLEAVAVVPSNNKNEFNSTERGVNNEIIGNANIGDDSNIFVAVCLSTAKPSIAFGVAIAIAIAIAISAAAHGKTGDILKASQTFRTKTFAAASIALSAAPIAATATIASFIAIRRTEVTCDGYYQSSATRMHHRTIPSDIFCVKFIRQERSGTKSSASSYVKYCYIYQAKFHRFTLYLWEIVNKVSVSNRYGIRNEYLVDIKMLFAVTVIYDSVCTNTFLHISLSIIF